MNLRLIEIVVHCYAEQHPCFASLLTCQLSSLALWPPSACRVRVTLCATPTDRLTLSVAKAFSFVFDDWKSPVQLIERMYHKQELFRRAIGRNDVAKRSAADVVWFADADYLFGPGCLDALAAVDFKRVEGLIAFPRETNIHRTHAEGDVQIALVQPGRVFESDLSLFVRRREKYAIGGLQIVEGETARRHGYCDGTRWVQPVSESGGFRNTAEDRVYRGILGGSTAIDLPAVYRMRHSQSAFESAEKRLSQTKGS